MREVIAETKARFEAGLRPPAHRHRGRDRRNPQARAGAARPSTSSWCRSDVADEFEKAGKHRRRQRGAADPRQLRPRRAAGRAAARHQHARGARRAPSSPPRRVLITDPATGGISGVHLMEVLDKLGIAEEMKSRLVPQPRRRLPRRARGQGRGRSRGAGRARDPLRAGRGLPALPEGVPAHHHVHRRRRRGRRRTPPPPRPISPSSPGPTSRR